MKLKTFLEWYEESLVNEQYADAMQDVMTALTAEMPAVRGRGTNQIAAAVSQNPAFASKVGTIIDQVLKTNYSHFRDYADLLASVKQSFGIRTSTISPGEYEERWKSGQSPTRNVGGMQPTEGGRILRSLIKRPGS